MNKYLKILIVVGIIALSFFGFYRDEKNIGQKAEIIPKELQLKTAPDKILYSENLTETKCLQYETDASSTCLIATTTQITKYRYVSDVEVPLTTFSGDIKLSSTSDEIIKVTNLPEIFRSYDRIDYAYPPTTTISKFAVGVQIVKNLFTNKWYVFDSATTTKVEYDKQIASATPKTVFWPDIITIRKVYAATSTFYPDPNAEVSSVDGFARKCDGPTGNFATARDWDGVDAFPSSEGDSGIMWGTNSGGILFNCNWRSMFVFNTATLDDSETINSATLSIRSNGKTNTSPLTGSATGVSIVSFTFSSSTNLVAADYKITNFGATELATYITYDSWSTTGYNTFTLNASGLAAISKTAPTGFGALHREDAINSSWAGDGSPAYQSITFNPIYADTAGTSSDPYLIVVTSAGGAAAPTTANLLMLGD